MSHGLQVGDTEVGKINWKRRFDHMQQHCGQHILSQSFIEVAGVETVSFHLGEEYCSIDLDGTRLSAETVAAAEESANDEVMRAELIRTVWVDAEGAQAFRLRKKSDRQSDIRIVAIGEFDHSGCGGTHPGCTSEVQIIKVTGWEQTRGHTRVEFICGNRAINNYQEHLTVLRAVANGLGVHWRETESAVTNLQSSLKAAEKSVAELKTNLASLKARSLLESATQIGPFLLVEHTVPAGNGPEAIRILGQQLVTQAVGPVIALLRTVGEKPYLVFIRNGRPGDTGPNLAELLRTLLEDLGGRGGGTPVMAQGGTPTPELATEIVSRAATFLRKASALQEGW
jgi:alanyl-tRNA synthetase